VDDSAILVRLTLYGDANLDGKVDTIDFNLLAANFGQSGKSWFNGDFDYSGTVNTIDFNLLASNFSLTLAGKTAGPQRVLVPEPAVWAIFAVASFAAARRKRRSFN